jgi:hypothetical protein
MEQKNMKRLSVAVAAAALFAAVMPVSATGLATCNSGPESGWKPQDALKEQLAGKGWKVRRIKVDGGCYEVYAINEKGERVEFYFHPVKFEHVLTSKR